MIRFAEGSSVEQATFQSKGVLDYFQKGHIHPRWGDRIASGLGFCDGILDLHETVSSAVKKLSSSRSIPRPIRQQVAENIFVASEQIVRDMFAGGGYVGSGVYVAPRFLPSACRGNCDWVFSGRTYVLKALVDIPDFGSLDQLTVSPSDYGDGLLTRMEKQRTVCFLSYQPERGPVASKDLWPCRCFQCSDGREAELNPMKCITTSCMEPIPCDSRASEPCPQCGACNGHILAKAQEEVIALNQKLIALQDVGYGRNTLRVSDDGGETWRIQEAGSSRLNLEAAFELELVMEACKLVHPYESMVKNMLFFRISKELELQGKFSEAWRYREKCLVFFKKYYSSYSIVDPRLGQFLHSSSALVCSVKYPPGRCTETCRKWCCRERSVYKAMLLEGRTNLVKFFHVEWTAEQVGKIVDLFDALLVGYDKYGLLAYHTPGFWARVRRG